MGSQYQGNRWTDEQLEAILFETVNGHYGQVLCTVSSLRQVLARAADFATPGAGAVSLCRRPADSITVFDAQIARLRKQCAGREVAGSAFL